MHSSRLPCRDSRCRQMLASLSHGVQVENGDFGLIECISRIREYVFSDPLECGGPPPLCLSLE